MASDEFSALLIDERVIGNMLDGQIRHRGHDLHCVDLRARGDRPTRRAWLVEASHPPKPARITAMAAKNPNLRIGDLFRSE